MDKAKIHLQVQEKIAEKIQNLEKLIAETRASNSDTKSSMGDKYETGREMLQQEISGLQLQLNENLKAQNLLKNIPVKPHQIIGNGSLVQTEKGWYYIAVSAAEIVFDNQKIHLISGKSLSKSNAGKEKRREFYCE